VADVRMPPTSVATPVAIVEPRLITIELDRIATRQVRVAPRFTGALAPGYLLRNFKVVPNKVTVRGPSRLLPGLDSLEVGPIDLRAVRSRAAGEFAVRLPSLELAAVPAQVRVELAVERLVTREFDGVRVRVMADEALVGQAEPGRAQVQATGTPAATEGLKAGGLEVVVDARGFRPGTHELPGQVDTLGDVILTPVPSRFRVRLEPGTASGARGSGSRGRRD
jgi:YbbR domain-containing protein